ncbi:class E sortase [Sphaerisporangium corydalis]|uniref:Class E sortase n=1 Tax=Sphaerisporangium corydalis TaxID=1441875 RepID=A0ABV9EJ13_9ACTN|nr:class E sortase [Sphaerisporangium corydalis]
MRALLRACGELSVTAGLVMLLFCGYLLWGTSSYTEWYQRVLKRELRDARAGTAAHGNRPAHVRAGTVGLIRIPRLGRDYEYAVLEGVTTEDLRRGPGHYPGTAMPGGVGNFVLSGHRTTYAAPFNRIDELRRGDEIIIDSTGRRYTYRVSGKQVVDPADVDVIAPVPGHPDRTPSKAVITLTTCHPEYSARQRLVVFGVLAGTRDDA